jgi:hypothetical protein
MRSHSKYLLAMNSEINPSVSHKESQLKTLCYLSDFHNQKAFSSMRREDILMYLDTHRKTEELDPLHKWVGTYNLRRIYLMRFFKWLWCPGLEPSKPNSNAKASFNTLVLIFLYLCRRAIILSYLVVCSDSLNKLNKKYVHSLIHLLTNKRTNMIAPMAERLCYYPRTAQRG